jgi:hypothetical protein
MSSSGDRSHPAPGNGRSRGPFVGWDWGDRNVSSCEVVSNSEQNAGQSEEHTGFR